MVVIQSTELLSFVLRSEWSQPIGTRGPVDFAETCALLLFTTVTLPKRKVRFRREKGIVQDYTASVIEFVSDPVTVGSSLCSSHYGWLKSGQSGGMRTRVENCEQSNCPASFCSTWKGCRTPEM